MRAPLRSLSLLSGPLYPFAPQSTSPFHPGCSYSAPDHPISPVRPAACFSPVTRRGLPSPYSGPQRSASRSASRQRCLLLFVAMPVARARSAACNLHRHCHPVLLGAVRASRCRETAGANARASRDLVLGLPSRAAWERAPARTEGRRRRTAAASDTACVPGAPGCPVMTLAGRASDPRASRVVHGAGVTAADRPRLASTARRAPLPSPRPPSPPPGLPQVSSRKAVSPSHHPHRTATPPGSPPLSPRLLRPPPRMQPLAASASCCP
jgi:hypothetical protein